MFGSGRILYAYPTMGPPHFRSILGTNFVLTFSTIEYLTHRCLCRFTIAFVDIFLLTDLSEVKYIFGTLNL